MAVAKQIISSGGGGVTYPITADKGGTGVASPTAHGILIAEGSGAMVSKVLTAGQILVGSTGVDPVATSITGGDGISVNSSSGTIDLELDLLSGTGITLTIDSGSIIIEAGSDNVITETNTFRIFSLSDAYTYIRTTSGSPISLFVPTNADVAFEIGTEIDVFQAGAGQVSFSPSIGVTINAASLLISAQYKRGTLKKVDTDVWDLIVG